MKVFLIVLGLISVIGCAHKPTMIQMDEPENCVWDGTGMQCEEGHHYEKPVNRSPAVEVR